MDTQKQVVIHFAVREVCRQASVPLRCVRRGDWCAVWFHCRREHSAGNSLRNCHENRENYVMRNFTVWTLVIQLYQQGGWHGPGKRLAWRKIRFVYNIWVGRDGSATGWTVWRSHPMDGEIFRTRPDRPWGQPNLLDRGYRLAFLGVKHPGHGVYHPPHLAPRLKKE
jgi:hypothetical protein